MFFLSMLKTAALITLFIRLNIHQFYCASQTRAMPRKFQQAMRNWGNLTTSGPCIRFFHSYSLLNTHSTYRYLHCNKVIMKLDKISSLYGHDSTFNWSGWTHPVPALSADGIAGRVQGVLFGAGTSWAQQSQGPAHKSYRYLSVNGTCALRGVDFLLFTFFTQIQLAKAIRRHI